MFLSISRTSAGQIVEIALPVRTRDGDVRLQDVLLVIKYRLILVMTTPSGGCVTPETICASCSNCETDLMPVQSYLRNPVQRCRSAQHYLLEGPCGGRCPPNLLRPVKFEGAVP